MNREIKLHDVETIESSRDLWTDRMRVEGGWIYRSYDKANQVMGVVFVPEMEIIGKKV